MTLLVGCAGPGGLATRGDSPAARDANHARSTPPALRFITGALAAAHADVPAPDAADAPAAGQDAATNVDDLFTGMYALDRLASETVGTTVSIRARRTCADVFDELRAGQWTIRSVPAEQNALGVSIGLTSYGDRLATIYLKDGDESCNGSLTMAGTASITADGALTASGSALELPLYCHVGPNPNGDDITDKQLTYFGLYVSEAGSFVMAVSGPAAVGAHVLALDTEGSEGVSVMPIRPGIPAIDGGLNFVTGFFGGQGDNAAADAVAQTTGMFYGGGTLTVTATDPLTATLSTDTLAADDSGEDSGAGEDASSSPADGAGRTMTLTASLHCDE
jgi:hypothetical protein